MSKLKILLVEGNTKEENVNFNQAGCVSQSENFCEHIKIHEPDCEVDIIEPADNSSMERIISSLKKYKGIILTGSTLRINENSEEVKKHIEFTRRCFEHTNYIYAACWGLQVSVAAAGGKCRVSPKGANTGIAQDVVLTEAGIKHGLYKSKPKKFNAPGFNFDEVEVPPKFCFVSKHKH